MLNRVMDRWRHCRGCGLRWQWRRHCWRRAGNLRDPQPASTGKAYAPAFIDLMTPQRSTATRLFCNHEICAPFRRCPDMHMAATTTNRSTLSQCPSLAAPYRSCWFLPSGGHVETILAWALRRPPRLRYYRRCLSLPDGGIVSLDFDDSPAAKVTWLTHCCRSLSAACLQFLPQQLEAPNQNAACNRRVLPRRSCAMANAGCLCF